jgi:hypothetical protein
MGSDHLNKVPVRLKVTFQFDSEAEARTVGKALTVDDDQFIHTEIDGSKVLAQVVSDSIEGARRAADDWMACMMAVLKKEKSDLSGK